MRCSDTGISGADGKERVRTQLSKDVPEPSDDEHRGVWWRSTDG